MNSMCPLQVLTRRAKIRKRAEKLGLCFDHYSPGDGVVRYRFGVPFKGRTDFFSMRRFHTSTGPRDAESFLDGFDTAIKILAFKLNEKE